MTSRTTIAKELQDALTSEVEGLGLSTAVSEELGTLRLVAPAVAEFVIALAAWEFDGTEQAGERLKLSYREVLSAWRSTASERASR